MAKRDETVLSIDIGTSSIKAGCITPDGRLVHSGHGRLIEHQQDDHSNWDARVWTETVRAILNRMQDLSSVRAIVISGNGPTLVPMDRAHQPITPTLLWFDGREARHENTRSFFLPKVAWFRDNRPELFSRTEIFLSCPEYLQFFLSGEAVTVTPTQEFIPYFWDDSDLETYGLNRSLFPGFVLPGTIVGEVTPEASQFLGIPEGLPVIAGGPDYLMSLVGTGTLRPGRTCDRAGTSEGINHCSSTPVMDQRVRTLPHIVEGLYNVAGILSSTGRLFEWFRDISGQRHVRYDEMLGDIRDAPDDGTQPWFFPSLQYGAGWEFSRGMFIELGARHGKAEMGRAVVLSIGYAVREAVEILRDTGCDVQSLTACGGQAKNDIWNQMKCDITGVPLRVPVIEDAELAGNACIGYFGLGLFDSIPDAAESLVRIQREYEPDRSRYDSHSERYSTYRDLYRKLREVLNQETRSLS